MRRFILMLSLFIVSLVFVSRADAKWWIFGQSNEETTFSYLYLNRVSYDETGPKVSFPRDSLAAGEVVLNGKVRVGRGKVGGVRVTLDDRASWQDAKLADDGTFEFRFRPEFDKNYVIFVEATDTAGKTNDVEKTRKEVSVINSDAQQLVRAALDELVAAYITEDGMRFMRLVSESFAGDAVNLDRAIRKDFTAFDNISLRFTLNNVALDARGMVYAAVTFSRSVVSSRSGRSFTDGGYTNFVFKNEEGALKVFAMGNPLIFGLSDAAEVATGLNSMTTGSVLVVDAFGNVAKVPGSVLLEMIADGDYRITANADGTFTVTFSDGSSKTLNSEGAVVSSSSGSTVESGLITLNVFGAVPGEGFIFADGTKSQDANFADLWLMSFGVLSPNQTKGVTMCDMGTGSISSVLAAPDPGSANYRGDLQVFLDTVQTGQLYAIKLSGNKFAVIEVTGASTGINTATFSFRYKYQTDGSRNF